MLGDIVSFLYSSTAPFLIRICELPPSLFVFFTWVLMPLVITFWVVAVVVVIWGIFIVGSELFRCVKRLLTFTSADVSSKAPPNGMAHTTLPLVVKIKPRAKVMRVVARRVHR